MALLPLFWRTGPLVQGDVTFNVNATIRYQRQILALPEVNESLSFLANFLYKQHPEFSYVVIFDASAMEFKLAKYNTNTNLYVIDTGKDIPALPDSRTRVQVIGYSSYRWDNQDQLGGLLTDEIAKAIAALPGVKEAGKISRVSLVGCSIGEMREDGIEFINYVFGWGLLSDLKERHVDAVVDIRIGVVGIDSTGLELVGEITPDTGIDWTMDRALLSKEVVTYDFDVAVKPITSDELYEVMEEDAESLEEESLLSFASTLDHLLMTVTSTEGGVDEVFYFDSDDLFNILSRVTKTVFDHITVPDYWLGAISPWKLVRRYADDLIVDMQVREYTAKEDIAKDIKLFGERGFQYPHSDNGVYINKDEDGNEFKDKYVYYRFGQWVLSMKYESAKGGSDMDAFAVRIFGIIHAENPRHPDDTKNTDVKFPSLEKTDYPTIMPKTDSYFFPESQMWMLGRNDSIRVNDESVYNAIAGVSLFVSESIRDYRSWTTSRLAMDLYNHDSLTHVEFFHGHPMVQGHIAPIKYTGHRDELWGSKYLDELPQMDVLKLHFSRMVGQWLSGLEVGNARQGMQLFGNYIKARPDSTDIDTGSVSVRERVIDEVDYCMGGVVGIEPDLGSDCIIFTPPEIGKVAHGPLRNAPWDGRVVTPPERATARNEFRVFSRNLDHSLSSRTSQAIGRDQVYLSEQMEKVLLEHGKGFKIDKESVKYEKGSSKVEFTAYDPDEPSNREEMEAEIDESKLSSDGIFREMKEQKVSPEGVIGNIEAFYGTVLGIQGVIDSFNQHKTYEGVMGILQTAHGISQMFSLDKRIVRGVSKAWSKRYKNDVYEVNEIAEEEVGDRGAEVLAGEAAKELSCMGKAVKFLKGVPWVGTLFTLYNIEQDVKEGTPIGYVDAVLDAAIGIIDFLGPEFEPLSLILMADRLSLDVYYADIKREFDALPPDASVGEKVAAFFRGVKDAILDMLDFATGGIFTAPHKSKKLDAQYEEDQELLRNLSDYRNYYDIAAGPDSVTINFAGGEVSWDGGDITFELHDDNTADLTMMMTDIEGNEVLHHEELHFDKDVTGIVMGVGETNNVKFTEEKVKVLWFIPVDKKSIIGGLDPDRETIHGKYIGNKNDNTFIAIQELPPEADLNYTLEDYHYIIHGMGGDDIFYLGPQNNLVRGGEGSDSYFISYHSTHTTVNNFAMDKVDDYLVINRTYESLHIHRVDLNLNVTSLDPEIPLSVIIDSWFWSEAYQHMHFKTSDGVIFTVSAQKDGSILTIPYGLIGFSHVDGTQPNYTHVEYIEGTDGDDYIVGNDCENTIVSEGGREEFFKGGNGADRYNLTVHTSDTTFYITIDNHAEDEEMDVIFLGIPHTSLSLHKSGMNLVIEYDKEPRITLDNWFQSEAYRHVKLFANDSFGYKIEEDDSGNPTLHPFLVSIGPEDQGYLDLSKNDAYRNEPVIGVIGSESDDTIIGHRYKNLLMGGKGKDYLTGGEGLDGYVMHEGDSIDTINNFAYDEETDLIMFPVDYDNVIVEPSGNNLRIHSKNADDDVEAILLNWQLGPRYQHLQIQTLDGVTFQLPTEEPFTEKTPLIVDDSAVEGSIDRDLNLPKWKTVQKAIGPINEEWSHAVKGNDLDNYLDMRKGSSQSVTGMDGSDTYIYSFKDGYNYKLYNKAEDGVTDTLILKYPLDGFEVIKDFQNEHLFIKMSTLDEFGKNDEIWLVDYIKNKDKTQHMQIQTSDGFTCVLPEYNHYQPVIVGIDKANDKTGQYVDLNHDKFAKVVTNYGADNFSNHIIGNSRNNTLQGGVWDDHISGGPGNDVLRGGDGNNTLEGGDGHDILVGGIDTDMMDGGPGDDTFLPGLGHNDMVGGPGVDTAVFLGHPTELIGIVVDLVNSDVYHSFGVDYIQSIENVYGTPYDDTLITAGLADNTVSGMNGDDILIANGGYDVLIGGGGKDTYDLTNARGTKMIDNNANDSATDTIILPYDAQNIRFDRKDNNLIIRIVSVIFFANEGTEPFNACNGKPPPESVDLYSFNNTDCTAKRKRYARMAWKTSINSHWNKQEEYEKQESNQKDITRLGTLDEEDASHQINFWKMLVRKPNNKPRTRNRPRDRSRGRTRGRTRGGSRGTSAPPSAEPFTDAPTTGPPTTTPPTTPPPTTTPPTTGPPTTTPPTTTPPTTPSPTTPPPDEGKKTAPLCEVFDPNKPTVILKDWFEGPENQHVQIETLNCLIGMDYLAKMPIKINCILEGC